MILARIEGMVWSGSSSSRARMNVSMGFTTQCCLSTRGKSGRTGGIHAQCRLYSAPDATQRRRRSICLASRGFFVAAGGMRSSGSVWTIRWIKGLAAASPGTTAFFCTATSRTWGHQSSGVSTHFRFVRHISLFIRCRSVMIGKKHLSQLLLSDVTSDPSPRSSGAACLISQNSGAIAGFRTGRGRQRVGRRVRNGFDGRGSFPAGLAK